MTQVRTFRLALATGLLGLTLAACGGGEDDATAADVTPPSEAPSSAEMEPSPSASAMDEAMAATGEPFGPGCASVPADGAGSFWSTP